MSDTHERGTGRTTRQIANAAPNSFYVCPNPGARPYMRELAEHLGRSDVQMVDPGWIERRGHGGLRADQVTFDHAAERAQ